MIVTFKGGPADKHLAKIHGAARQLSFPVLGPLNDPTRERSAIYRLEQLATGAVYRFVELQDLS